MPNASYNLSYDALKRLSSVQDKNYNGDALMTHTYTYLAGSGSNTSTLVSQLTTKKTDGTTLYSESFTYDNLGNITGISGSTTSSFTYDNLNQLTAATVNGVSYAYSYNAAGNITSKTINGVTTSYTYGNSDWRDLLTAYNGHSITYDTIGNPLSYYDGTTFTWAHGRQLATAVNTSTGLNNSYTYDSDGLRLTKIVNGVEHRYTWQGDKLVAEYWDGKKIEYFYGPDGTVSCIGYRPSLTSDIYIYYLVKNLQGDVIKLVNKSGTVYATYTYDPYGNVLTATGSMADINPIRYRSYYYDTESGYYYLKSRYYDPALCRFINADGLASTGQGFLGTNMFAYCNNNPVNSLDPSGSRMDAFTEYEGGSLPVAALEIASVGIGGSWVACSITLAAQKKLGGLTFSLLELYKLYKNTTKVISNVNLPEIAKNFGSFLCEEAANAMKAANKNKGCIVQLTFLHAHNGFVVSDSNPNIAISVNGIHFGYLYRGVVYCNVYPEGKPLLEWINSFHDVSDLPPIVTFYG